MKNKFNYILVAHQYKINKICWVLAVEMDSNTAT